MKAEWPQQTGGYETLQRQPLHGDAAFPQQLELDDSSLFKSRFSLESFMKMFPMYS